MTLGRKKNTINYTVDVKRAQRRELNVVFFSEDFAGNLADPSHVLGGQAEVWTHRGKDAGTDLFKIVSKHTDEA
jgi:hypothetical protein